MNLQSFYFSFEPTGDETIDLILSAVANAGKYFHSTERWAEDAPYKSDDDLRGRTPLDWIQNAANEAAQVRLHEDEEELASAMMQVLCEDLAATSLLPPKKSAYSEGYEAQKTTYIDECPYTEGSPEYGAWHEGYSDADIADELRRSRSKSEGQL